MVGKTESMTYRFALDLGNACCRGGRQASLRLRDWPCHDHRFVSFSISVNGARIMPRRMLRSNVLPVV